MGGGLFSIPDKSVPLVLTDIPYGCVSGRKEGGLRRINKDGADEVNFDLGELVDQVARVCSGSVYMFCGPNQVSRIYSGLVEHGLTCRTCFWEKTNPSPMNGEHLWLSSVECCIFGRWPKATFNEFCKSPVWRFPSGSSKIHPTQKPMDLFRYLVRVSSNPGDLVLDPFMGSGTTACAAAVEGRPFLGFELNPTFHQVANQRLRELTGPFKLYGDIGQP